MVLGLQALVHITVVMAERQGAPMSDDRKLTTRELLNTPDSVLEIIAALRTKMEKVEKERDEAQHSQKDWDHLKNLLLHANIDCETWYTRYEALRTERDRKEKG